MMKVITDTASLKKFCDHLKVQEFITVDTEFSSDKTYFAKLCLIQVGSREDAAAIDVLAKDIDLTEIFDIFFDEKILKVFHAAKKDFEIIYHLTGKIPHPVFDTQVAASVCGYGEAASYELLVRKITDEQIDKSHRFTNWEKRPLTDKQIHYALSDVTHLYDVYLHLEKTLKEKNRETWIAEEMDGLTNLSNYEFDEDNAWKKIKMRSSSPKFIALVKELAKWRDREARHLNIPRPHLLKDHVLLEVAASHPSSMKEIRKIRNIERVAKEQLLKILEVVESFKEKTDKNFPKEKNNNDRFYNSNDQFINLLKLLLKMKADENDVAEKIIAISKDLLILACEKDNDIINSTKPMHGWRYEIFGKFVEDLKAGKLGFKAEGKKIVLFEI